MATVDEKKPTKDIMYAYADLIDMLESLGIVLFRRSYGNAIASMPRDEHMRNWRGVLDGINDARMYLGFATHPSSLSNRFLVGVTGFYTGLSVLETAHIDDVNDHYSSRN